MPRPAALLGTLALDRAAAAPLQRQLYDALREAILAGRLAPRTRLPSSRQLARDLGAARNTIVGAFEQLVAEGYLEARVGDGTRVTAVLPESLLHVGRATAGGPAAGRRPELSVRGRALISVRRPPADPRRRAFQPGLPALDEFPRELWARLLARRARMPPRDLRGYAHPAGLPALREAIAAHLGPARGVACDPGQVVVVSGSQAALDLCCRLLLDPGDAAWIEEPGYLGARGALTAAGARLVPVPVDAHGIDVREGIARFPAARLAYVTPSHQFPLAVTMTLARRLELLAWAAEAGAWIIEDDYDSEYRYAGRPVAAMQGLDAAGRVISVGTFSKTMFAALRAAWLVVPPMLVDTFAAALRITGHGVDADLQAALADFLGEGHFAAHVRRMRGLYADRQARLVRALHRRLSDVLEVAPRDGGMQLPAFLPAGVDDVAASNAAEAEGVIAAPLSVYPPESAGRGGFYLGYAGVPEREITAGVERLARALERRRDSRRGGVVRRAMVGSPPR